MAEHSRAGTATEGRVATYTPPRAQHRKVHGQVTQEDEHSALLPLVAPPTDEQQSPGTRTTAVAAPQPQATAPATLPHDTRKTGTATSAEQTPGRDPLLDNAKFIAIALVVVGHAIQPLYEIPAVRAVYFAIYTFHMPAFILIAGYLSRSYTGKPRQAQRIVTSIVVPYLVFEFTYEVFNYYAADGPRAVNLLEPSFAMWFLCALFVWRITSPLWCAMRPALAVTVAVALSLVSGAIPLPQLLDLYRVFGFLPYFVLGLVLSGRYFELVRTRVARALAVPTLLAPFVAAYVVFPDTQFNWLYYTFSYQQMGVTPLFGAAGRLLMLLAGFAAVTAFLALAPRRHTWFTALGAGTLYVYLLHRFVAKSAEYSGIYEHELVYSLPGAALAVVLALVLTLVLSSKPVLALFRPLVEPGLEWLFRSQWQHPGSQRRHTGGHRHAYDSRR